MTLINEATNVTRDVDTGSNGEYLFIEVPVGSYEIDVTQQGFKKYVRKGVALNLNEVISLDIALQIGATAETVEVTGAPPVVDTTSTQLGAVVNERASTQLPLNQRDVYQLLQLQPGVQSQLGNDLFYGSDKAGVVTVNGGRGRSNNYSVNGGDGNDLFANLPAVRAFARQHRGVSRHHQFVRRRIRPQLGRGSERGDQIGNQRFPRQHIRILSQRCPERTTIHVLHLRPSRTFKQNQFGGTFGGPIKKDKTFFFGSYEGRRIVQGVVSQPVVVPTGSAAWTATFRIWNPFTGFAHHTDGCQHSAAALWQCRSGFPCCQSEAVTRSARIGGQRVAGGHRLRIAMFSPATQIPTGCFDPRRVSLLQYVPGAGGSASQVVTVPKKRDRGDQFQVRVDHAINSNQKLSIYYYFDDDNFLDPFAKFQAEGAPLGNFPGVYATRTQQINVAIPGRSAATSVNEVAFHLLP